MRRVILSSRVSSWTTGGSPRLPAPPLNQRGFTLLEVVVVLVLLALMAAVAVPKLIDLIGPSRQTITEEELLNLKRAIVGNPDLVAAGAYSQRGYEGDVGTLPDSLKDLVSKPGGISDWDPWKKKGWNGPYIDSHSGDFTSDAWGSNYIYDKESRTITSYGPDRVASGGDDIVIQF